MQLTYLPHGQPKTSSEEEGRSIGPLSKRCCKSDIAELMLTLSDTRKEGPSLLLVLKWGGELTPAGRVQAEELGRAFRCMYPGGQGEAQIGFGSVSPSHPSELVFLQSKTWKLA